MIGNSQASLGSCNSEINRLFNLKNVEKCSKKLRIGFGGRFRLINCPKKLSLRVSASKQPVPVLPEKFSGEESVNSKPVSFDIIHFLRRMLMCICSNYCVKFEFV